MQYFEITESKPIQSTGVTRSNKQKYLTMKHWNFYITLAVLFTANIVTAQDYSLITNWDYMRQLDKYEKIRDVIETSNGLVIAVGETMGSSFVDTDGLVVVLDAATGEQMTWKKAGGFDNQSFASVVQLYDGTLLVSGYNEDVSTKKIGWIVQMDIEGEIIEEWKTTDQDIEIDDLVISEAGTIMALVKSADKGSVLHVVRFDVENGINAIGFSSPSEGWVTDIEPTGEDAFILVGSTSGKNRNFPSQAWATLIDANGKDRWGGPKFFGDRSNQEALGVTGVSTGGYAISGANNGKGAGASDMWLVRIDDKGNLMWDQVYGGEAGDVASDVIELAGGGFALLGNTWSHLPRAKNSTMQIILVDESGTQLDHDIIKIHNGEGDEMAYSLTESNVTGDLVIVGNSGPLRATRNSLTYLTSVSYRIQDLELDDKEEEETYGSIKSGALQMTTPTFHDDNANNYIEANERGFVSMEVSNHGAKTLNKVTVDVKGDATSSLKHWNKFYVGTLNPGATKTVRIPVYAGENPPKGMCELDLDLVANGTYAASQKAVISTNQPNPANLVFNQHHFEPGHEPAPGEIVTLTVEMTNIGGASTDPLMAEFDLPAGVTSKRSERMEIPSIAPQEKYSLDFTFSYEPTFTAPNIKIGFETNSTETVVGIKKSFTLQIPNNMAVVTTTPVTNAPTSEIFWVSHDVDEFRRVEVSDRSVDVRALAVSQAGFDKKNFAVLINGRRSQGQKLDESKLTPPKNHLGGRIQQTYGNTVQLAEGENEVQIVYYSEDGNDILARSTPLRFHYIPKGAPSLYVVSIGVNHEDLKYTTKDAQSFADMYAQLRDDKGRGFKKVDVIQLLSDQETTENNIKRAFLNLSRDRRIKENDLVVVFISSHGKVLQNDRYVLLPSDYDPQYEELSTIDFNEDILKRLRNVDGNKLVFIDACHSGSAGSRSFSDAAASKVMSDLISATAGMEIFASCGENEFSYEDDNWQNGAFTKAIIEAFENKEVEIDGKMVKADIYKDENGQQVEGEDGVITIEELKRFVQVRVPFLVKSVKNKPQNPINKSSQLLPKDMGIFMVNK